jgi:hypothetical protein
MLITFPTKQLLLPLLQYPIGVDTSFENILQRSEGGLRWNLDPMGHDPMRGTARADVASRLLSRESDPGGVNSGEDVHH